MHRRKRLLVVDSRSHRSGSSWRRTVREVGIFTLDPERDGPGCKLRGDDGHLRISLDGGATWAELKTFGPWSRSSDIDNAGDMSVVTTTRGSKMQPRNVAVVCLQPLRALLRSACACTRATVQTSAALRFPGSSRWRQGSGRLARCARTTTNPMCSKTVRRFPVSPSSGTVFKPFALRLHHRAAPFCQSRR